MLLSMNLIRSLGKAKAKIIPFAVCDRILNRLRWIFWRCLPWEILDLRIKNLWRNSSTLWLSTLRNFERSTFWNPDTHFPHWQTNGTRVPGFEHILNWFNFTTLVHTAEQHAAQNYKITPFPCLESLAAASVKGKHYFSKKML